MKKQTIQKTEYVLDERDAEAVKALLNYGYHRIKKHGKTLEVSLDEIQRLRKEFWLITEYRIEYKDINADN